MQYVAIVASLQCFVLVPRQWCASGNFMHYNSVQCNAIRSIAMQSYLATIHCCMRVHCCSVAPVHISCTGHWTIHCQCCAGGQAPHFSLTAIKTHVLDMLVGTVLMMMRLRMMRIVMMTNEVFHATILPGVFCHTVRGDGGQVDLSGICEAHFYHGQERKRVDRGHPSHIFFGERYSYVRGEFMMGATRQSGG